MKLAQLLILSVLFLFLANLSQAQLFRPYKCGPVLKMDRLATFDTLNQFLDIKPRDTYAEIGASSGYYNGAMAVYLDSVTMYLQDVDESCLNKKNLDRLLKYYSKFRDTPIDQTNEFHIVIGTNTQTNLPENSIDVIYSNATLHVLDHPDSIFSDLYAKLKDDGTISIRDQFADQDGQEYCDDRNCGHPLMETSDFLAIMKRNRFVLIDETDQFGYPIYKFKKDLGTYN